MIMRKLLFSILFVISLGFVPTTGDASMDILYMFEGGPDDGAKPYGSLTHMTDGRLCGMTSSGGAYSCGVIFVIDTDGSDYGIIHHFGGAPSDGCSPHGSLTEMDGKLYGMTSAGGSSSYGVIFSIKPNGSDYDVLYHFGTAPDDGSSPLGSLTYVDSLFYGMTGTGGAHSYGVIFSVKPDGSDYTLLHHFGSYPEDGITPVGSPTYIDSLLFGMTMEGGAHGGGTLFSMLPDGSDYIVNIDFGNTSEDPVIPVGSLEIGPSGSGRNFAFLGDGYYVARPGFGIP